MPQTTTLCALPGVEVGAKRVHAVAAGGGERGEGTVECWKEGGERGWDVRVYGEDGVDVICSLLLAVIGFLG